jgi:hypothetical protein
MNQPENVWYRINRDRIEKASSLLMESHLLGNPVVNFNFQEIIDIVNGLVRENINLSNRVEELKRK